jgi:glycosyltransferase involved in cell wall biosynthesis
MKLNIIRDGAYTLRDGRAASNLLHYNAFGKRYLDVFSEVEIIGRLFQVEDESARPVEGDGVRFFALPGRHGALGFAKNLLYALKIAFKKSVKNESYILRIPGTIPSIFFFVLLFKKIPFSVEVAADPYDSYSKKSLNGHAFSSVIQTLFVFLVKYQCKKAEASVYVTEKALQSKYPPGNPAKSFSFTSLDLKESSFVLKPRDIGSFKLNEPRIVLVGNMQGSMKGHDVLIHALSIVRKRGVLATLTIIGFGSNQKELELLCLKLGVSESIHFLGKMESGQPIFDVLRNADLFVLPSRQEGLPRAMIESMSQALPAIGTRVGGTPELLDSIAIVESDQPVLLADKIIEFISSPELMVAQSKRNLENSFKYSGDTIRKRRNSFLKALRLISSIDSKGVTK